MPSANQNITSNKQAQSAHRDELDLSRPEDLEFFLESAEDVYADAIQYQTVAKAEQYKSLSFDDVKGEEVFDALFNLLKELQQHIVECKEKVEREKTAVDDAVVTQMQEFYDSMVLLRDLVSDTYKERKMSEVSPNKTISSVPSKTDDTAQPNNGEVSRDTKERDQLFAVVERELETARRELDVVKARVLNRVPPSARTAEVATKLDELKTCFNRLKTLRDRVKTAKKDIIEVAILRRTFGNYSRLIQDITKKSNAIEQELMQQQSEATINTKSIPSDKMSQVRPVAVVEVRPSELRKSGEEIPSEAEVVQLAKRVTEDQFYTEAERRKTQELCESFHRAVATGEQVPAIVGKYKILCDHVETLERSPDIAELRDRASRIIQRITTGLAFDDEVLRKARQLEHEFRQLEADPEKSDERLRNTYVALVKYAKEHEKKWLTVCGMHVPLAGQKGMATARSLRETLLVERDRHGELVRDPKKQVLVDKLVRKLSFLPPSGLSEASDLPEVIRLMRAIDVPGQQGKLVNPAGQSVPVSSDDEKVIGSAVKGFGSQDPKHKVMNISTEDKELAIEIRVANKTKERIAEQTEKKATTAIPKRPQLQPVVSIQKVETKKAETAAIAQTEVRDPINTAVPVAAPRITRTAPVFEKRSLTKLYLSDPVYQAFIARYYTSPAAFERMLDTVVTQIEEKTVDAFERWLHEEHSSPFALLEELTVGEVLEFGVSEEVRAILTEQNIKYETFLTWYDLINEMQSIVGDDPNMRFGELYAKWVVESEMLYYNEKTEQ